MVVYLIRSVGNEDVKEWQVGFDKITDYQLELLLLWPLTRH